MPRSYLDPEYRRPLVLQELLGYHADVICLQEVDETAFSRYFQPQLHAAGDLPTPDSVALHHALCQYFGSTLNLADFTVLLTLTSMISRCWLLSAQQLGQAPSSLLNHS